VLIDYRTAVSSRAQPADEPGAIRKLRTSCAGRSSRSCVQTNPSLAIDWPSPVTGVVLEKKVVAGQMVKAGEEMFRLVDLSKIWVITSVTDKTSAWSKSEPRPR
jgi:multidrug efflux pump subunit AcrA (membrane-fusion protein)